MPHRHRPATSVPPKTKMEDQLERDRILTSTPKDHSSQALSMDKHERRTLQTLQLSATGNKLNGGKERLLHLKDNSEGRHKTAHLEESFVIKPQNCSSQMVKVYEDSSLSEHTSIAHCCRLIQTDDSLLEDLLQEKLRQISDMDDSGRVSGYMDQEAYDLMVKDEVSETYWKDLAEERRRALDESLTENEKLHSHVEILTDENKKLAQENVRLKDIADKAEALQKLLEEVISDDADICSEGHSDNEADCDPDSEPGAPKIAAISRASQAIEDHNKHSILDSDSEEGKET